MTEPQAVTQKHLKMQSFRVKNILTVFISSNSGELPIPQEMQRKKYRKREEKIVGKKKDEQEKRWGVGKRQG